MVPKIWRFDVLVHHDDVWTHTHSHTHLRSAHTRKSSKKQEQGLGWKECRPIPLFDSNLSLGIESRAGMTGSIEITTTPKSTKSRNTNFPVQIQIKFKAQFEFVEQDTKDTDLLDLVGFEYVTFQWKLSEICGLGVPLFPFYTYTCMCAGPLLLTNRVLVGRGTGSLLVTSKDPAHRYIYANSKINEGTPRPQI